MRDLVRFLVGLAADLLRERAALGGSSGVLGGRRGSVLRLGVAARRAGLALGHPARPTEDSPPVAPRWIPRVLAEQIATSAKESNAAQRLRQGVGTADLRDSAIGQLGTSAPLLSTGAIYGGVPHTSFDLSSQPASLGSWQLQLTDADIAKLPASLMTSVTMTSGQVHRIRPDVVEDMLVVLQLHALGGSRGRLGRRVGG